MTWQTNHLLSIEHLSADEIYALFELADALKKKQHRDFKPLQNKSIGLIFEKPSMRTRVSFEVGIQQLGGHALYLRSEDIELGKRESVADVAKVIARYLDGVVIRTFAHSVLEAFAKHGEIPVVNALSDTSHPCQVLADLFTIQERRNLADQKIVFVGDGNNVCHSWMIGAAKLGLSFTIACPQGFEPDKRVIAMARSIAKDKADQIIVTHDAQHAVENATVIYTDVWVSMGQEKEEKNKKKSFRPFQVNQALVSKAAKDVLVMHCLPAHRGEEITDEVMDGSYSIVYDQAENRLHVQKAILGMLFKSSD